MQTLCDMNMRAGHMRNSRGHVRSAIISVRNHRKQDMNVKLRKYTTIRVDLVNTTSSGENANELKNYEC